MKKQKHFETIAIRHQVPKSGQHEHSVPIYATSSFVFDNSEEARATFANEVPGNIYSRFSNPNTDELISKLSALEELEDGISTGTGMAAIFSSMAAFLNHGDHIVASRAVFGSTHQIFTQIFPRWDVTHTYVDGNDPSHWEKALKKNTKMLFLETPSNPGLDIVDLEMAGMVANRNNLILNVDNSFATPYLQVPARFGAHLVTHSATKFIDGHGRVLGGAVLGNKDLIEKVRFFTRHTGPALSPFNGWLLSKSLETLAVRMEKHCSNALEVAKYLETNKNVNWVKYPLLTSHPQYEIARKQMDLGGGLISFEIKRGMKGGVKMIDNTRLHSITANLGDTRSIITHPASTTHSKLSAEERLAVGITDGLIRISVGLEHVDDIIADLDSALSK